MSNFASLPILRGIKQDYVGKLHVERMQSNTWLRFADLDLDADFSSKFGFSRIRCDRYIVVQWTPPRGNWLVTLSKSIAELAATAGVARLGRC